MSMLNTSGVDETWYRSRQQRVLIVLAGYSTSAFVAVLGVALIGVPGAAIGEVALLAMAWVSFVVTRRCARAGACVNARGVSIVNPRRTVQIDWSEVDRFSVGEHGLWSRIGLVHLADGSTVAMWGIQGPNPRARPNNRSAEDMIDMLNAQCQKLRS